MYVIQYDFKQNADFLCMYILQIKKKEKKNSQQLPKLLVQTNENRCQSVDAPLIVLTAVWF